MWLPHGRRGASVAPMQRPDRFAGMAAWARQAPPGRAEKKHSQVTAQPQPLRAAGLRSTSSRIKPSDVAAISLPPTGPGWERKWMMLCLLLLPGFG